MKVHLVDAMYVSKGSSDGEHGADGREGLVDFEHLEGRVRA